MSTTTKARSFSRVIRSQAETLSRIETGAAKLIRDFRKSRGMKAYQFAEWIGVSHVHVSYVENGHKGAVDLLKRVAEKLKEEVKQS